MTELILCGCGGKMGAAVRNFVQGREDCKIVAGVDIAGAAQADFPVYARGVTPNGPYKNGPGEIGGAVTVGGIIVHPGDIVVGDADGVIVIPPEEAEALAEKVRAFNENEAVTMERIAREGAMPRPWVEQKMEALGVEYVD